MLHHTTWFTYLKRNWQLYTFSSASQCSQIDSPSSSSSTISLAGIANAIVSYGSAASCTGVIDWHDKRGAGHARNTTGLRSRRRQTVHAHELGVFKRGMRQCDKLDSRTHHHVLERPIGNLALLLERRHESPPWSFARLDLG